MYSQISYDQINVRFGLWCLMPFLTVFQLYRGGQYYWLEETRVHGENYRPAASHCQTLSHNVVLSTPRLNRIRTHNVSGDRH
jgi:hypothetical protein